MEDQIISFDTAVLAKEIGFNLNCNTSYDVESKAIRNWKEVQVHECIDYDRSYGYKAIARLEDNYFDTFENDDDMYISAPTQTALLKWIREEHKIHIEVLPAYKDGYLAWDSQWMHTTSYNQTYSSFLPQWASTNDDSYEQALENGLIKALNLIK